MAEMDEILQRAGRWPSGDERRWEILDELEDVDLQEVLDKAMALCESDLADDRMLGAEILDDFLDPESDFPQAEEVLRRLCRPDEDPGVLAAALGPYAVRVGHALELYFELLDHSDARVRAVAARVLGYDNDGDPQITQRITQALIRLVHEDPEPRVRTEAADRLVVLMISDGEAFAPHRSAIAEALSRHLDDDVPALRCAAIDALIPSASDVESLSLFEQLKSELTSPDVDQRFVRLSLTLLRRRKVPKDVRRGLYDVLLVLRETGWAERAQRDHLRPIEREALLNMALDRLRVRRWWSR